LKNKITAAQYAKLSAAERLAFCGALARKRWEKLRRPEQVPGMYHQDTWVTHLTMAGRGFGKELALDTPILTANRGWITMGDIEVGDVVFDESGAECNVTFVSEPTNAKPMFRLNFSDGSSLVASDTHEWLTSSALERKASRRNGGELRATVRETIELYATQKHGSRGDTNHSIQLCKPIVFSQIQELKVDPYMLGVWLGDGASKERVLHLSNRDESYIVSGIDCIENGFRKQYNGYAKYRIEMDTWQAMRSHGLSGNKHIPRQFMSATVAERKSLLAGIIDTDGTISTKSACEITLCNERLAHDVHELIIGLGIKAVIKKSAATLNGKTVGDRWRITFTIYTGHEIPVRSSFKAGRIKPAGKQSTRQAHRMIRSVVRTANVPCRCISVDSPSRLYLAGRHLIPTHNTRAGAEWILNECISMPGTMAGILAPTYDHGIKVCLFGESGVMSLLADHSTVKWNEYKKQLTFANGSMITLYSSEHQKNLAGPQFHRFWIDEPADLAHGMRAWKKLRPAVRLPTIDGSPARILITGTPAPVPLVQHIWELTQKNPEIYTLSNGRTMDNEANLDPMMVQELYERYKGSRYFLQEMEGQLLLQADGALWTSQVIHGNTIPYDKAMHFDEVVVSIDPAVSTEKHADETGIIVAGISEKNCYILADYSVKASALDWIRKAYSIAQKHGARKILYERNLAGPMIEDVFKKVLQEHNSKIKLVKVQARKSKGVRAEPIAALYEAGRVFHVSDTPDSWGSLEKLESQMTTWEPKDSKSPDRIDALVHAVNYLLVKGAGGARVYTSKDIKTNITMTGWNK
jgi:phage terminase large subunit-like protein